MSKRVSNNPPILTREESLQIWEDVKKNTARLKACPKHMFPIQHRRFGEKFECFHCKGKMDIGSVLSYCQGFEAAGGNAREIWGEWKR